MSDYDHKEIEKKWQDKWQKDAIYKTEDEVKGKENFYNLVEFPYPSGNLHVGHWYAFAVSDIYARLNRMQGKNVMFPVGFDAFGLPAENAAIKRNLNPKDWTYENMDYMRNQLKSMGASFDWDREVVTCDPSYYKWTQWLFTQFFEKGLAYQAETNVNWCPSCKTGLANEQVIAGKCERCDSEVEQKKMNQWMMKITDYADKLVDDLDDLNWPEEIKSSQKNWIGRSEGAEVDFEIRHPGLDPGSPAVVKVFTTRLDTVFGATYIVLAPEHKLLDEIKESLEDKDEVEDYVKQALKKTELNRIADNKEKTGVELKGIKAINPANNEEVPIFVADYVLGGYGTGAIMAVPAHDERDNEFAKKFELPIEKVINKEEELSTEKGVLINSDKFNGLESDEAISKIADEIGAKITTQYKLRDWLISRQRYWGCPIPIIHCEKCGPVSVPKENLPVELPEIDNYLPSDDGRSPLAKNKEWVKTTCPKCNEEAERETDTLDTFIDSSWYFLRYADPKNSEEFADEEKIKTWLPVDFYSGGAEHTTMHLLYSRFFTKVLNDLGLVGFNEPFERRLNRGLILGPDGNKMSKSKGNVIDPDEIVERLGADTVRIYLAFIGPYNEVGYYPWDPNGVVGSRRFLERVLRLSENLADSSSENVTRELHKTIKKVTEDSNKLKFNTAISSMMIFLNKAEDKGEEIGKDDYLIFIKLLSIFAPHLSEEIWNKLGNEESVHLADWPTYDEKLAKDEEVEIAIQVNGKVRGKILISPDEDEDSVKEKALKEESVVKWLEENEVKKVIYIKGRLVSIVI